MTNVLRRDSNVQQVVAKVHEVLRPGAIDLNDPNVLYMPGRQWADERGGSVHEGDYLRRRIGDGAITLDMTESRKKFLGKPAGKRVSTLQLREFPPIGSREEIKEVVIDLTHARDLPSQTTEEAIGILSKFGLKTPLTEENK